MTTISNSPDVTDIEQGVIPHHRSSGEEPQETGENRASLSSSSSSSSFSCNLSESSKVSVNTSKVERDCRICHVSFDGSNNEYGLKIELGCSCKEDLAAAHKHCAETWFKIRGNKTCEICGATARNVIGVNDQVELMEQWNEANDNDSAPTTAAEQPRPATETRHFWQEHKFLNFLLACMVFAFVISWLFHFNVPS